MRKSKFIFGALAFMANVLSAAELKGHFVFPKDYPDKSDTLIWIEKEGLKAPPKNITIDQIDMAFKPFVSVVSPQSTIYFTNNDGSLHGVKAQEGPLKKFRVMMTPKKNRFSFKVKETGVSEILCDIHSQMRAFVVSIDSPFWSLSDAEGRFAIAGIPEPPFKIKTWHPVLPPQEFSIQNFDELRNYKNIPMKVWN